MRVLGNESHVDKSRRGGGCFFKPLVQTNTLRRHENDFFFTKVTYVLTTLRYW